MAKPTWLLGCLLTALSLPARAQTAPVAPLSTDARRESDLHGQALSIVEAERARAKQPTCPNAETTVDINDCFMAEVRMSDSNYAKLVRVLGALLRAAEEIPKSSTKTSTKTSTARIPFDEAEKIWHTYRNQACNAAGHQYLGGTMRGGVVLSCQLILVTHHIDELWDLYSDLGTR